MVVRAAQSMGKHVTDASRLTYLVLIVRILVCLAVFICQAVLSARTHKHVHKDHQFDDIKK